MPRQTSLFDYCIVDSFAGDGGASTGIEIINKYVQVSTCRQIDGQCANKTKDES